MFCEQAGGCRAEMPEFWQKVARRARETLPVWRQFLPLKDVGGVKPDQHAAEVARFDELVGVREDRKTAATMAKALELAGFNFIRTLNLEVPKLIEGEFAEGHAVREPLAALYQIVPRSDALNLKRARMLVPAWKAADAALSARAPGGSIVREGIGVAGLEAAIKDYPKLQQASADAGAALAVAQKELRTQARKVDQMNKRIFKVLRAEADTDAAVKALAGISKEPTTRKPAPDEAEKG